MQGLYRQLRTQLAEWITALPPDQYFSLIFFGDSKLFEFASGRLVKASEANKSAALRFISRIAPAGRTNMLQALARAAQIQKSTPRNLQVYLLTDGLDVAGSAGALVGSLERLLRSLGPAIQIHTIGLWPQQADARLLKAIAARTGGRCILVTDTMPQLQMPITAYP